MLLKEIPDVTGMYLLLSLIALGWVWKRNKEAWPAVLLMLGIVLWGVLRPLKPVTPHTAAVFGPSGLAKEEFFRTGEVIFRG